MEISVLQTDIDQESQEMRAIDPNMTTDLSDTMMPANNQVQSSSILSYILYGEVKGRVCKAEPDFGLPGHRLHLYI
jgi:hypothetical protein